MFSQKNVKAKFFFILTLVLISLLVITACTAGGDTGTDGDTGGGAGTTPSLIDTPASDDMGDTGGGMATVEPTDMAAPEGTQ